MATVTLKNVNKVYDGNVLVCKENYNEKRMRIEVIYYNESGEVISHEKFDEYGYPIYYEMTDEYGYKYVSAPYPENYEKLTLEEWIIAAKKIDLSKYTSGVDEFKAALEEAELQKKKKKEKIFLSQ